MSRIDSAKPVPTGHQIDVIRGLSHGLSVDQIAGEMNNSPATIRTHIQNAMYRTRTHSRAHLIAVCLREGWLR